MADRSAESLDPSVQERLDQQTRNEETTPPPEPAPPKFLPLVPRRTQPPKDFASSETATEIPQPPSSNAEPVLVQASVQRRLAGNVSGPPTRTTPPKPR